MLRVRPFLNCGPTSKHNCYLTTAIYHGFHGEVGGRVGGDLKAVEQLASDQASLKAAAGLTKPTKWSGLGASHDATLIWGECAGSGANPYRVMADLRDMGSKCTCPSRKFPCKHALALLWINVEAIAPFPAAETPDWVSDWLGRRRTGAAARPVVKAESGEEKSLAAALSEAPEPATDEKAAARRAAASAKRAEDTERAILDALDALEQWIGDQLRLGLGGFVGDVTARCRRIAARLVDGKAAALAGHIDELPARLLEQPAADRIRAATVELGRLVLLARAYRAEPRAPELRRAVATTENREALLADPGRSVWRAFGKCWASRCGRGGTGWFRRRHGCSTLARISRALPCCSISSRPAQDGGDQSLYPGNNSWVKWPSIQRARHCGRCCWGVRRRARRCGHGRSTTSRWSRR
ncbi:SWIM zinc finger family protein [Novosphingobium rhizosphaerae]|uniref:SWIM zinc finger family protein n=1 Tax=Novosphingobium rhizosphaerae TaxID=1551649 RepID=UPI003D8177B3